MQKDVPFLGALCSLLYSSTGCQNKAICLEPVIKSSQKGYFVRRQRSGELLSPIFHVLEYNFYRSFMKWVIC